MTGLEGRVNCAVPSTVFLYSVPMVEVHLMDRVLGRLGEESLITKEERDTARPESVQDTEEELAGTWN